LGGADRAADGGFVFAVAPGGDLTLDAEGAPVGRFLGEVSFQAHGGMLAVRLALVDADWTLIAAALLGALVAHVADLAARWPRGFVGSDADIGQRKL
ncbi:MAG: hypothetical protein ACK4MF_00190, partial [Hyphomicrobiaceae bacterium]